MLHRHLALAVHAGVLAKIRLTQIGIKRCAAAAADDVIHAMRARGVLIALNPVLEEVLVAGESETHVMRSKQRQVPGAQQSRRLLDDRPAVWA